MLSDRQALFPRSAQVNACSIQPECRGEHGCTICPRRCHIQSECVKLTQGITTCTSQWMHWAKQFTQVNLTRWTPDVTGPVCLEGCPLKPFSSTKEQRLEMLSSRQAHANAQAAVSSNVQFNVNVKRLRIHVSHAGRSKVTLN
jgi:hypothetical protein